MRKIHIRSIPIFIMFFSLQVFAQHHDEEALGRNTDNSPSGEPRDRTAPDAWGNGIDSRFDKASAKIDEMFQNEIKPKKQERLFRICLMKGGTVTPVFVEKIPVISESKNIKKLKIVKTEKCTGENISATRTTIEVVLHPKIDMNEELKKINASQGECHYVNDLHTACEDPITKKEYKLGDANSLSKDTISNKGEPSTNRETSSIKSGAGHEK